MNSVPTLFGSFTSPFVRHCRIALLETGLPCEFSKADNVISAKLSPMQKVPFLAYSDQNSPSEKILSDSVAILKFIREQSHAKFLEDVNELNSFCAANTFLDSALNLFFMEKDGITAEQSAYLQRQQSRIQSALREFEKLEFKKKDAYNDFELRLACALDWALFRNRISLQDFPNLQSFLTIMKQYPAFVETQPPADA